MRRDLICVFMRTHTYTYTYARMLYNCLCLANFAAGRKWWNNRAAATFTTQQIVAHLSAQHHLQHILTLCFAFLPFVFVFIFIYIFSSQCTMYLYNPLAPHAAYALSTAELPRPAHVSHYSLSCGQYRIC